MVGSLVVGNRDEGLDPAVLRIAHRKELLMLLHRGLQHLGRQAQEILADAAHQHHRPFHQPRHFGQQALVLDHLKPRRKSGIGGVGPDMILALGAIQHHLGTLELGRIILERMNGKATLPKKAMPLGRIARLDTVHV